LTFIPMFSVYADTLTNYHSGCMGNDKSTHSDCMAAAHRYCTKTRSSNAGVIQEIGNRVYGTACFTASWYGDVSINELSKAHSGCNNISKSQDSECLSAVHRWCSQNSKGGAGVVQEIGNNVFGVACFNPQFYQDVSLIDLKNQHSGCDNLGKSQTSDCRAAIHRWCVNNKKGNAGLSQEVGAGVFGVACIQANWYGDVSNKGNLEDDQVLVPVDE
ncbi:MAG: hypothetical protein ACXW0O_09770, partial [Methylosarcina sp.]